VVGTVHFLSYAGVVKTYSDVTEIPSKNQPGTILQKRDLTVMDDSGTEVRVTLWNLKAVPDVWGNSPIVAFKALKVGVVVWCVVGRGVVGY